MLFLFLDPAVLSLIIFAIDQDEFDYAKTFFVCLGTAVVGMVINYATGGELGLLIVIPLVAILFAAVRSVFYFTNKQAGIAVACFAG